MYLRLRGCIEGQFPLHLFSTLKKVNNGQLYKILRLLQKKTSKGRKQGRAVELQTCIK